MIKRSPPLRVPTLRLLDRLHLRGWALDRSWVRRLLQGRDSPEYACILESRPHEVRADADVELHMLVSEKDFLRSVWALKKFFHFSGLDPALVIHDDGSLSARSREAFRAHFVGCEIPEDASARAVAMLDGHPMCQFFRRKHVISGKLLDVLLFSRVRYLIVMDSDILWFRPSEPIAGAVERGRPFFMAAGGEGLARNRRFLEDHCGLQPARNVNSGLVGFLERELRDWPFIEQALDRMVNVPRDLVPASLGYRHFGPLPGYDPTDPVDSIVWWVMEQTLYAVLFGRCSDLVPLAGFPEDGGPRHQFTGQPIDESTAVQHFISDPFWNSFFPIGVDYLMKTGFLAAWNGLAGRGSGG